jgi:hypothetical protein
MRAHGSSKKNIVIQKESSIIRILLSRQLKVIDRMVICGMILGKHDFWKTSFLVIGWIIIIILFRIMVLLTFQLQ